MSADVFDGILGHEHVLALLMRAISAPAPGYLFFGPDGVGKRTVAERFARALLQQPASLSLDAHPDFVRVVREEEAKDLTIKQARELMKRMQFTSAHGGKRVALIDHADRWNSEACNALLKAVEEPPAGVVYLFVTEHPDTLPATLRSRLVPLYFGRVPEASLHDWLVKRDMDMSAVSAALQAARGCPGVALRYTEDADAWRAQRASAAQTMQMLAHRPLGVACGALERTARCCDAEEDPESAWRAWLSMSMQELGPLFVTDPRKATDIALGLVHAWTLAGTTLSPRLGLEWALSRSSLSSSIFPSVLYPSYL
ncbi:MAG: AAA family ATPase [Patescibacteria group bacterium]